MRRAVATLLLTALALAGPAAAATDPVSHPPDPRTLRAAGIAVSWPVRADREFAPGARIVVRVRALRRGGRRPQVRVALQRVDGGGRVLAAIARRTLRSGLFSARLGDDPGAHYALDLAVGRRRYVSYVTAAGVPGPPVPPPPPVATEPSGPPPCPTRGTTAFTLDAGPTPAHRGDAVTLTVVNTGDTCLTGGMDYSYERQMPDGSYQPVDGGPPVPAVAVVVRPGETFSQQGTVWDNLTPGSYRIVKTMSGPDGPLSVAAPFEVSG